MRVDGEKCLAVGNGENRIQKIFELSAVFLTILL